MRRRLSPIAHSAQSTSALSTIKAVQLDVRETKAVGHPFFRRLPPGPRERTMRDFLSTLLVCASLTAGVFGLQAALSMAMSEENPVTVVASFEP